MLNAWLNGSTLYFPRPWNQTKYTSLQTPALILALLDAGTLDSGSFYFWPLGNTAWIDNVPSDRHLQASNLSFADGHVEYHRWRWPKSVNWDAPVANQADLEDLRWLQARTLEDLAALPANMPP
jgi:prepilin-type processing-associated H-X9-DG protein